MILIKLILTAIVFICLWLGIKYLLLIQAKQTSDKAFAGVYNKLQPQYDAIINLFSQFPVLSLENRTLVQNTKKLILTAQDFTIEKDGNERIIGYANSILNNVQRFAVSVLEKEPDNESIKKYNYLLAVFNKPKEDYNKSAQRLKHYVDTFPTSFYARLKDIKTMDFFNC